ncbi:uncharacterized protein LOC144954150 [Lampetra fluviatilis]
MSEDEVWNYSPLPKRARPDPRSRRRPPQAPLAPRSRSGKSGRLRPSPTVSAPAGNPLKGDKVDKEVDEEVVEVDDDEVEQQERDDVWNYSPLPTRARPVPRPHSRPPRAPLAPRSRSGKSGRLRPSPTVSAPAGNPLRGDKVDDDEVDDEVDEEVDMRGGQRCPSCQAPLSTLGAVGLEAHAERCVLLCPGEVECPRGLRCASTVALHYRHYSHTLLATARATGRPPPPPTTSTSSTLWCTTTSTLSSTTSSTLSLPPLPPALSGSAKVAAAAIGGGGGGGGGGEGGGGGGGGEVNVEVWAEEVEREEVEMVER